MLLRGCNMGNIYYFEVDICWKHGQPRVETRLTRWVKRTGRNEDLFARLNGLREHAETAIFRVGDLDLPGRRGIPVVKRRKMHRCALVLKQ